MIGRVATLVVMASLRIGGATASRGAVLFLGDSLTEGLGVDPDEAYPALIGAAWAAEGVPLEARNAGVSGSTTKDALSNLDWYLTPDVRVLFLALGANDGLRGLPLTGTEHNLDAIIRRAKAKGIVVVLAGLLLPPNYGAEYTRAFAGIYRILARRYRLALMPFLLEGVAGRAELNNADGIHPNAAGHRIIARHVHDFLAKSGALR